MATQYNRFGLSSSPRAKDKSLAMMSTLFFGLPCPDFTFPGSMKRKMKTVESTAKSACVVSVSPLPSKNSVRSCKGHNIFAFDAVPNRLEKLNGGNYV